MGLDLELVTLQNFLRQIIAELFLNLKEWQPVALRMRSNEHQSDRGE